MVGRRLLAVLALFVSAVVAGGFRRDPHPADHAGPVVGGHAHGDVGWLAGLVILLITVAAAGILVVAFRRPRAR